MTTKWSPASCTVRMGQSMSARDPSRIGEPVTSEGCHLTSANLSTLRLAIVLDSSAWSAGRKFTQNRPDSWICGHAREVFEGMNSTSGGSNETLEKDWEGNPTRSVFVGG